MKIASVGGGSDAAPIPTNDTLDYCRAHAIQVQAWSPLRGIGISKPSTLKDSRVLQLLQELAAKKGASPAGVALAWILSHPANIVPIIGTSNSVQFCENIQALRTMLSRGEWGDLAIASLLPA